MPHKMTSLIYQFDRPSMPSYQWQQFINRLATEQLKIYVDDVIAAGNESLLEFPTMFDSASINPFSITKMVSIKDLRISRYNVNSGWHVSGFQVLSGHTPCRFSRSLTHGSRPGPNTDQIQWRTGSKLELGIPMYRNYLSFQINHSMQLWR